MLLRKGDIVRVIKTGYESSSLINDAAYMHFAEVLEDQTKSAWVGIRVDFPEPNEYFHDLSGLCEYGYGWYCDVQSLELVTDIAPVNEDIGIGTDSLMEVLYGF